MVSWVHMAVRDTNNKVVFEVSNGTILRVIISGILVFALYYLRSLVLVILTSIVIASFVQATSRKLSKYRINRVLSVVLMYILIFAIIAAVFYIFVPILVVETSNLISLLTKYIPASDLLQNIQASGQSISSGDISHGVSVGGDSVTTLVDNAKVFVSNLSLSFFDILTKTFGGILNVVLIGVISFYLSIEEGGIEKFLRLVTPRHNEQYIISLWQRTQRKITLWIRGQLILGLIVGVLIYLGLLILGVHYALVLAIAAAIFELIPFGIVLAAVPAISFAYIDGGLTLALLVTGFYVVVQQFESYLIQPWVVRKVVGISPLVVILSVLIGAKLAGFWGIILAIPVAVALLEFADDVEKRKSMTDIQE